MKRLFFEQPFTPINLFHFQRPPAVSLEGACFRGADGKAEGKQQRAWFPRIRSAVTSLRQQQEAARVGQGCGCVGGSFIHLENEITAQGHSEENTPEDPRLFVCL